MPDPEIIFRPHYNGRTSVTLVIWPISAAAFLFFAYDTLRSGSYYSEGLLALIFGLAAFGPPFIYFRQLRFADSLVVKRYLLPDVIIDYKDIVAFQYFSLRSANARVALNNLTPKSFEELDAIVSRLAAAGKIPSLKKKR